MPQSRLLSALAAPGSDTPDKAQAAPEPPAPAPVPASHPKPPADAGIAAPGPDEHRDFWAPGVVRVPDPTSPPSRARRRRRWFVGAAAALLVINVTAWAVFLQTRSAQEADQQVEVLGERFTNPAAAPSATAPANPAPVPSAGSPVNPLEAMTTATVDGGGRVVLTQTLVWTVAVPAMIDLLPAQLTGVSGIPDDVAPDLGQPSAVLDGQPLQVGPGPKGGWRVQTPSGRGRGSVVLTYSVSGAVHRDKDAAPGRALAVIPLPPLGAGSGVPRQLSLPADTVLNVSCPSPNSESVLLCGTQRGDSWLVTAAPGTKVVLAQLNLPVP